MQSSYGYVVPDSSYGASSYSSGYASQQPIDEATSELRPGMILPDGSKVISVGPPGAAVPNAANPAPSGQPAPAQPAPNNDLPGKDATIEL